MRESIVCVVSVALLLVLSVNADRAGASASPRVEIGMGRTLVNFNNESAAISESGKNGLAVGFYLEMPVGRWRCFCPGVRYLEEGHSVDFDTGVNDPEGRREGHLDIEKSYLGVPILMKFEALDHPRIFITFGPEVGFLLSATANGRESLGGAGGLEKLYVDRDISDDLKAATFALDGGLGIALPMGRQVVSAEVRYTYGVGDAADRDAFFSNWQISGIEVLVGLSW